MGLGTDPVAVQLAVAAPAARTYRIRLDERVKVTSRPSRMPASKNNLATAIRARMHRRPSGSSTNSYFASASSASSARKARSLLREFPYVPVRPDAACTFKRGFLRPHTLPPQANCRSRPEMLTRTTQTSAPYDSARKAPNRRGALQSRQENGGRCETVTCCWPTVS